MQLSTSVLLICSSISFDLCFIHVVLPSSIYIFMNIHFTGDSLNLQALED